VLPVPPSANHYLGARGWRRFPTAAAQAWRAEATLCIRAWCRATGWRILPETKIVADYWIWWPDTRRRDAQNLKILWDALEGYIVADDRWFLPRCQDWAVDRQHPRVELRFRRQEVR
jgi:Holliday junction resolvase RusA-like endonuclease